jgi:hypothetical protein
MRYRSVLLVVGIALGLFETTPKAADSTTIPVATPVLKVRLTISNELPSVSRKALVNETESIWRDAHVQLRWLDGNDGADPGPALRILVTHRAVVTADGQRWAVGELLRFEDSTAVAMASISAALRIVEEGQGLRLVDLPAMRQYKLGVVLGRAVAHEIGHYLLDTNTHAPYGLMRASIDAREFADLRTGTFRLDREAVAHLAARASMGRDSLDVPGTEFSYPKD